MEEKPKDEGTWLKKKQTVDVNEPTRNETTNQPGKFIPPGTDKPKSAWGAGKGTYAAPKAE